MSVALAVPKRSSRWSQYYALTKPRVVQLIVFCALIGAALAVPGLPSQGQWLTLALAVAGIWLVAGSAAAFNCVIEQEIDARMRRTAWRPTAKGELNRRDTLLFSGTLCALGTGILWWGVNPLTAGLTLATFVGYAIIYTVVLKPLTPQNIVIGGASGAMPPVLGWAAMTNEASPEAWLLCLIIFLWTPPHFWALALYRTEDYRKAGLPMLPFIYQMSGWIYLASALVLGVWFLVLALQLWHRDDEALARKTFRFSIWHLSLLFAALLVDHYLLPWQQRVAMMWG